MVLGGVEAGGGSLKRRMEIRIEDIRPEDIRTVADGLRFPEGPVACADGSVILVEIAAGALTRVAPNGVKTVIATPGGGPNAAAIGPDGQGYVRNNRGVAGDGVR